MRPAAAGWRRRATSGSPDAGGSLASATSAAAIVRAARPFAGAGRAAAPRRPCGPRGARGVRRGRGSGRSCRSPQSSQFHTPLPSSCGSRQFGGIGGIGLSWRPVASARRAARSWAWSGTVVVGLGRDGRRASSTVRRRRASVVGARWCGRLRRDVACRRSTVTGVGARRRRRASVGVTPAPGTCRPTARRGAGFDVLAAVFAWPVSTTYWSYMLRVLHDGSCLPGAGARLRRAGARGAAHAAEAEERGAGHGRRRRRWCCRGRVSPQLAAASAFLRSIGFPLRSASCDFGGSGRGSQAAYATWPRLPTSNAVIAPDLAAWIRGIGCRSTAAAAAAAAA